MKIFKKKGIYIKHKNKYNIPVFSMNTNLATQCTLSKIYKDENFWLKNKLYLLNLICEWVNPTPKPEIIIFLEFLNNLKLLFINNGIDEETRFQYFHKIKVFELLVHF